MLLKHSILILVLASLKCHCMGIDITIDTEFSNEEDSYHKYKTPSKGLPNDYHKYQDVEYKLVKMSDSVKNTVLNEDTYGFLHRLRKVVLQKPRKGKGKKAIYRQAITLIANSAQKDHQYGTRKLVTKIVPKMYMPLPQAISHILGKEHIPYGVYDNLSHNYNYRAK